MVNVGPGGALSYGIYTYNHIYIYTHIYTYFFCLKLFLNTECCRQDGNGN